jgi:hypothetical protein
VNRIFIKPYATGRHDRSWPICARRLKRNTLALC